MLLSTKSAKFDIVEHVQKWPTNGRQVSREVDFTYVGFRGVDFTYVGFRGVNFTYVGFRGVKGSLNLVSREKAPHFK